MKFKQKFGCIVVVSSTCLNIFGYVGGVGKRAKGAALFPFIFIRSEEYLIPRLINHERIHFRQQLETLFIGSFFLAILERIFARVVLKKTNFEAYLFGSGEQEAYLHQNDLNYLKQRPLWKQFYYLKYKKNISLTEKGEIVIK